MHLHGPMCWLNSHALILVRLPPHPLLFSHSPSFLSLLHLGLSVDRDRDPIAASPSFSVDLLFFLSHGLISVAHQHLTKITLPGPTLFFPILFLSVGLFIHSPAAQFQFISISSLPASLPTSQVLPFFT